MSGVAVAILPFPGQLGITDHPGSGIHQVALHPLELIAVTRSAAILPTPDKFRVRYAKDTLMRLFLFLFKRLATMAGDTVTMGFGDMFDPLVTADAGGLFRSLMASRDKDREAKQEHHNDMSFAVSCIMDKHVRRVSSLF